MTTVKHENSVAKAFNSQGAQVIGMDEPDLNGLSPRELIEAAIALCTTITTRKVLERDGVPFDIDKIEATVTATKEEGVKRRYNDFDVQVTLPEGLDEEYKKKLMATIERGCTISNTVKQASNVVLTEKK